MEEPTKKAVLVMCGSLNENAKKGERINAKSKEVKKVINLKLYEDTQFIFIIKLKEIIRIVFGIMTEGNISKGICPYLLSHLHDF